MEGTAEKTPKNKKTVWVAGGLVVALVVIVYFSFFYPPVTNDEGQGTIGAAKKYRSEQISDKDVTFATVEKADEATIKEMENVAQKLGQAAIDMKAITVASKYYEQAAVASAALAQAAALADLQEIDLRQRSRRPDQPGVFNLVHASVQPAEERQRDPGQQPAQHRPAADVRPAV